MCIDFKMAVIFLYLCQIHVDMKQSLPKCNPALAHYDATKPLQLACDVSPYGVGAVLSQFDDDGMERLVAFVS